MNKEFELKPIAKPDIPQSKWQEIYTPQLVQQFLDGTADAVEVSSEKRTTKTMYECLRKYVRKYKPPIRVILRKKRLFLVKVALETITPPGEEAQ